LYVLSPPPIPAQGFTLINLLACTGKADHLANVLNTAWSISGATADAMRS